MAQLRMAQRVYLILVIPVSVIEECLIWCHRHRYGVMEGDELVGSLGYR